MFMKNSVKYKTTCQFNKMSDKFVVISLAQRFPYFPFWYTRSFFCRCVGLYSGGPFRRCTRETQFYTPVDRSDDAHGKLSSILRWTVQTMHTGNSVLYSGGPFRRCTRETQLLSTESNQESLPLMECRLLTRYLTDHTTQSGITIHV